MLKKNYILGTGITNDTRENILEYILKRLKSGKKFFIVTPNPEILVYANSHKEYKTLLNESQVALPDGIGLIVASWFLSKSLKERITGVDFIENICIESAKNPMSIGFLGGRLKVAERAANCLKKKYPWIKISFISEEWDKDSELRIKSSNLPIDILFVAFGFPKQEEWIYANLKQLPIRGAMGVGGAFDYLSGDVMRAPGIIQKTGFEWLFRLIRQPWRFRRQIALFKFAYLVFEERFLLPNRG